MPLRTPVPAAPSGHLPLVFTNDGDLLDDLLRLAAAGGTEVDLVTDPVAARPRYVAAPLVLIGIDQVHEVLRARLPRRPGVILVGNAPPGGPAWEFAELIGAEHVAMLPAAESWLVDRFAERFSTSRRTTGRGGVIAVIGGRGGAGASVLAGGLAVTAKKAGLRTLLVDADPLGGGLDLVLGWEDLEGLRWPALTQADGHIDAQALVHALPSRGSLVVLSGDRSELLTLPSEAMAATMDAARRACDLVVVDLPRRLDDAAVIALAATDRVLVVVPAELRATAAAAKVATAAGLHCTNLAVIVRGPAPGRLKAKEVAQSLGLPLAGTLRPEPALCRGLERGEAPASTGRGPLAVLCRRLVTETFDAVRGAA